MTMKCKTRLEIASEYGICRKTLYNWLKSEGLVLKNRFITPKEVQIIYEKFGKPGEINYKKNNR